MITHTRKLYARILYFTIYIFSLLHFNSTKQSNEIAQKTKSLYQKRFKHTYCHDHPTQIKYNLATSHRVALTQFKINKPNTNSTNTQQNNKTKQNKTKQKATKH